MKKWSEVNIEILDLGKSDSYTQRGRYIVCIDGERRLSGDSEVEALRKTLAMIYSYQEEYKAKYLELTELCGPIVNFIRPYDNED